MLRAARTRTACTYICAARIRAARKLFTLIAAVTRVITRDHPCQCSQVHTLTRQSSLQQSRAYTHSTALVGAATRAIARY